MKSYNYRHNLFILTLFISSLIFGMELTFKVDNTPENRAILQTSKILCQCFKNFPNNNEPTLFLPLIQHAETWQYMKLLHDNPSKKSILKELKQVDKITLINLSNQFNPLNIQHKKINLLDLCCTTLAKKLDSKTDKKLVELILPEIRIKLSSYLLSKVSEYSNKIIRPTHSFYSQAGPQLSFGPRGNLIIDSGPQNNGIIFSLKQNKIVCELEGHDNFIVCVAINSNETRGFTGSMDNYVKVWDIPNAKCLYTFTYDSPATAMACNNATTQLICGYRNGVVKIWDIVNGSCLHTFRPTSYPKIIKSVAFNRTGSQAIVADYLTAKIYCTTTGKCLKSFDHESEVTAVTFSDDGNKAVTGSFNCAFLWDLVHDTCIRTFTLKTNQAPSINNTKTLDWICSVELTKDEKRLYTIPYFHPFTRNVWDARTGAYLDCIGNSSSLCNTCPIPDNYMNNQALKIHIFSNPTQKEIEKFETQSKQSMALIRALIINTIYENYAKRNEVYSIKQNSDADIITQSMPHEIRQFLFQILSIKRSQS